MSLLTVGIVAVVLWLVWSLIHVPSLILLLLLVPLLLARPLGSFERKPDGGISIKWDLQDYIGAALVIAVFYAIYSGVDAKTLICSLKECK